MPRYVKTLFQAGILRHYASKPSIGERSGLVCLKMRANIDFQGI